MLTGVSTNGGVESTLRQGTGLGLGFVVVEDACSGQDAKEHRFAFERIFPRLARVRNAQEVLKALAATRLPLSLEKIQDPPTEELVEGCREGVTQPRSSASG